MNTKIKPGKGFMIIGVIALLWNLMGVFQFLASTFMKDQLAETYTAQEMELVNSMPSWYTLVFAICVFTGLLGSVFMLLRKNAAVFLFFISLATVLIVQGYWLLGTNAIEIMGAEAVVMPMIVIIISIFLYFYNKGAQQKGWLS